MKKLIIVLSLFILISLICAGLFLLMPSEKKINYTELSSIKTEYVNLTKEKDISDSPSIRSIALNGKTILNNDHVGFSIVYPSLKEPEIVVAWSDCGGSACGRPFANIIDLKTTPVKVISVPSMSSDGLIVKKVNQFQYQFLGYADELKNEYGDYLELILDYDRKSGQSFFITPYTEQYKPYVGKHPDSLLGDKDARSVFLSEMSPSEFKRFRNNLSVASGIRVKSHGIYIVGSGIAPHSGGHEEAFFIIDTIFNQFIAGIYSDGALEIKTNMNLDNHDIIRKAMLQNLIDKYGYQWDFDLNQPVKTQ